jgi:hypothetical protein
MRTLSLKAFIACLALSVAITAALLVGTCLAANEPAKAPAPSQAQSQAPSQAKDQPQLANTDCAKCHPQEPQLIAANGAKHKTAVTCLNCHREHPPLGKKAVPECSMCHKGKAHYAIGKCGSCHANTHTPLAITFPEGSSAACVSCHGTEGDQLKKYPSAHSKQECTLCHPTKHRAILKCAECHSPHLQGQTYEECLACHKPHMPLNITYKDPANKVCAACHAKVAEGLDKTATKHHDLKCAYCHRDKHGMVPTCETCHGQPHPAAMHQKFPKCNQCHIDAHALVK